MTFGEFFRAKRLEKRITLRQFCLDNKYDPGNISKLETGVMAPPQSDEKLNEYAKALSIKKGSEDYIQLFDLAAAANRTFQVKNITDEKLLEKLPVFFRTLDNKKLTEEKLEALINIVKSGKQS